VVEVVSTPACELCPFERASPCPAFLRFLLDSCRPRQEKVHTHTQPLHHHVPLQNRRRHRVHCACPPTLLPSFLASTRACRRRPRQHTFSSLCDARPPALPFTLKKGLGPNVTGEKHPHAISTNPPPSHQERSQASCVLLLSSVPSESCLLPPAC
jgi:hypothetical protein